MTIGAGFRPAVKYAKLPRTREWWAGIMQGGEWVADGCTFRPSNAGWMEFNEPLLGSEFKIADRMADWALTLIEALSDKLPI